MQQRLVFHRPADVRRLVAKKSAELKPTSHLPAPRYFAPCASSSVSGVAALTQTRQSPENQFKEASTRQALRSHAEQMDASHQSGKNRLTFHLFRSLGSDFSLLFSPPFWRLTDLLPPCWLENMAQQDLTNNKL